MDVPLTEIRERKKSNNSGRPTCVRSSLGPWVCSAFTFWSTWSDSCRVYGVVVVIVVVVVIAVVIIDDLVSGIIDLILVYDIVVIIHVVSYDMMLLLLLSLLLFLLVLLLLFLLWLLSFMTDMWIDEPMEKIGIKNESVTDGPTKGQTLLKRCEDASKNSQHPPLRH